jgi:hypothetical protein
VVNGECIASVLTLFYCIVFVVRCLCSGVPLVEAFYQVSRDILPDNAHELCNGRVFISITVLSITGPKNLIISQFGM